MRTTTKVDKIIAIAVRRYHRAIAGLTHVLARGACAHGTNDFHLEGLVGEELKSLVTQ